MSGPLPSSRSMHMQTKASHHNGHISITGVDAEHTADCQCWNMLQEKKSQQINLQAEGVIATAGAASLRKRTVNVPIVTENPRDVKYYSNSGHILSKQRWRRERRDMWLIALEWITSKSTGRACKWTMSNYNQGINWCPWIPLADRKPSRWAESLPLALRTCSFTSPCSLFFSSSSFLTAASQFH